MFRGRCEMDVTEEFDMEGSFVFYIELRCIGI